MREAIRFHIEGLLEDGLPVPAANAASPMTSFEPAG